MGLVRAQIDGLRHGLNRLNGLGSFLTGAIFTGIFACLCALTPRLSHIAVIHCSTLLGMAELICATAMSGQCAVYLGSLQAHFVQTACLFGLLSAMEFFGRLNRSAQLLRLPGFGSWLWGCLQQRRQRGPTHVWQTLDYHIAISSGTGSSPSDASLDSKSQMRLGQLCLLLFLMLLLWLCIKGVILIHIVIHNKEPRIPEKEACANVLTPLPPMLVLSTTGRTIILFCALLPS